MPLLEAVDDVPLTQVDDLAMSARHLTHAARNASFTSSRTLCPDIRAPDPPNYTSNLIASFGPLIAEVMDYPSDMVIEIPSSKFSVVI